MRSDGDVVGTVRARHRAGLRYTAEVPVLGNMTERYTVDVHTHFEDDTDARGLVGQRAKSAPALLLG